MSPVGADEASISHLCLSSTAWDSIWIYDCIQRPDQRAKGAQSHPRLWIVGGGEQVTLQLMDQYADACNVGVGNAEVAR